MALSSIQKLRTLAGEDSDRALSFAVLAAHPDDETIGASAVLVRFPLTHVIFLTDGAPRDQKFWPPDVRGKREHYAEVRRLEALKALAHAQITPAQLHWLGGVDQESILEARRLGHKLARFLAEVRTDVLITHPYEGGHPDHDSAALIARIALRKLPPGIVAPALCEMTSYHAREGQCATGEFLHSDPSSEVVLRLTKEDRECKHRMMNEYRSQRLILESFPIVAERLRVAPAYDFTDPPHEGELWYEHMGWTTGQRWREMAGRACTQAQECSCP
jgi:N-acetylglucosamine malate deacetylase 2